MGIRRWQSALLLAVVAMAAAGCAKKRTVRIPVAPSPPRQNETGVASWYGNPYHGRATASGEIYDMDKLTAAHRTLPFQMRVRVHNLDNRRKVDVRITDRGPFIDGRIIDLSRAAARSIDMIGPGTAHVRLELLGLVAAAGMYSVQAGTFRDRANADAMRGRMEKQYGSASVTRAGDGTLWRVLAGGELNQNRAKALAARIRRDGVRDAVVIRVGH